MKSQSFLRSARILVPILIASVLSACGGGAMQTTKKDPAPNALVSVAVTPGSANLPKGMEKILGATGTYADGSTKDVTAWATWSSSKANVATVHQGVVKAVGVGDSVITASVAGGASGSNVDGSATVSVKSPSLTSISVSPATFSVALGVKKQFSAVGTYSDATSGDVTSSVTWSSSDPSVATVSGGQATTLKQGSATITATSGSISDTSALTVTAAELVSIAVSPANVSIPKGTHQQYAATGTYTDGSTADLTGSVTWSATSGASITSGGMATGTSGGAVTISAQLGSVSGTTSATVAAGTLVSIAVSPATASIPKGLTQQYTATGTYTDGGTADITSTVSWTASSGASINASGLATGSAASSVTITAQSGSVSGTASLTVNPPDLVSIAVNPSSATIARSTTQQFAAIGTYTDGSTQNLTATSTWGVTAGATITPAGLATGTAVSTVTISATSGSFSKTATLTVVKPALSSIVISPASVTLGIGGHQQYSALGTYVDAVQEDVTASIVWQSANPAVVSFGASGLASVVGTNGSPISITATSGSVTSNAVSLTASASLPRVCDSPTIDLKLLVVTNGKGEADYAAITQILDYVGTPYTVFDMAANPGGITAAMLSDGQCHAYYQGVIFTLGDYVSSLPGMATLTSFEQTFHARQVNWYTFPTSTFGFNAATAGTGNPMSANFSTAAATVFPQVNTATPLSISGAWVYLATAGTPAQGTVTPLLTDNSGNALSLLYDMGDGRQYLTQTFDSNGQLTHGLTLAYGLINWVTKGIFLGDYHVYSVPQVDDLFMQNDEWQSNTPCPNSTALPQFRLSASDVDATSTWQSSKQQNPLLSNFTLHFAFVGSGATGDPSQGGFSPDTLTPAVLAHKSEFKWLSHTWSHLNLNAASAAVAHSEIVRNNSEATLLGLPGYTAASLVTPQISGLNNPDAVNQAVADGVRYVVSDTSVLGQPNNGPNPSPNVGLVNTINSGLYMVPRQATNLFYNVGTPEDWTAEYQCVFAGQAPYDTYTYDDIRHNVSQTLLTNMLKGDMDPLMFHMSNLHAYDGSHSILGDLLDETLNNYTSLLKFPVLSPTLDQIALSMQARNVYNQSGVTASLVANTNIEITIPAASPVSWAVIPVTGLNSTGAEVYAGQKISHVSVNQGQTVTMPLQ